MLDQPITLAEVCHVVKAIRNNKSAGSDGIVTLVSQLNVGVYIPMRKMLLYCLI